MMKKYLLTLLIGVVVFIPSPMLAATLDELRAQIEVLLKQLSSLQAQVARQQGTPAFCFYFNRNLRFGDGGGENVDREPDVRNLQIILEKEGFPVSDDEKKGGSVYEDSTSAAVVGFQEKYRSEILTPNGLARGTGRVGPSTRAKLNKLYGCGYVGIPRPINPPDVQPPVVVPAPVNPQVIIPQPSAPTITALSKNEGRSGDVVVIFGTGFARGSSPSIVQFLQNGIVVASTNPTAKDSDAISSDGTQLKFIIDSILVANGLVGSYQIRIETPGRGVSNTRGFVIFSGIAQSLVSQPSIVVLSPNAGEWFTVGAQNVISWSGGSGKAQIGLMTYGSNVPYPGVLVGWISLNAAPNSKLIWDGKTVTDLNGNAISYDPLNNSQGPFKILAVSAAQNGNYCFSTNAGCNYDFSDGTFTIHAAAIDASPLYPVIAEITGMQASYALGGQIALTVKGMNKAGSFATSNSGYHIQAYIYRAVANPSATYSGVNGTYDAASGLWKVVMNVPTDLGSYNLDVILYCSRDTKDGGACGGAQNQLTKRLPFTVTGSSSNVPASTLQVLLDPSSPITSIFAAGSSNVTVGVLRFTATNENIDLRSLTFFLSRGNTASLRPNVSKFTLWDGSTKVGEGYANEIAPNISISNFVIPKDGYKLMTVKIDSALIGVGQPGVPGSRIAVDFFQDGLGTTYGVGASSGSTIKTASASTAASGQIIHRSYPTVMALPLPSQSGGGGVLARFKVNANATGDVGLHKLALAFATTIVNVSNVNLYAYNDSNFSQPALTGNVDGAFLGTNIAVLPANGTPVVFSPTNGVLQVPAGGSRYFELRGAVSGGALGSSVQVSLLGDISAFVSSDAMMFMASALTVAATNNFVWSPNSTKVVMVADSDWTNGFGLNIPAQLQIGFTADLVNTPPAVSTQPVITPFSATGGTITTSGGYIIHTFTGNGAFMPSGAQNVEVLVVAGGGGGGGGQQSPGGGGGGAGGVLYNASFAVAAGPIAVTVGSGGSGGIGDETSAGFTRSISGGSSSFGSLTAIGGGGGAAYNASIGLGGGSGGGGAIYGGTAGSGTANQGNMGGAATQSPSLDYIQNGAGGGGAGGAGGAMILSPANTPGGSGGSGKAFSISGTSVFYGGGGGGGNGFNSGILFWTRSIGGSGGGGQGGLNTGTSPGTLDGLSGASNTGGGGGGAGGIAIDPPGTNGIRSSGGNGGSGVVIIRYPTGGALGAASSIVESRIAMANALEAMKGLLLQMLHDRR